MSITNLLRYLVIILVTQSERRRPVYARNIDGNSGTATAKKKVACESCRRTARYSVSSANRKIWNHAYTLNTRFNRPHPIMQIICFDIKRRDLAITCFSCLALFARRVARRDLETGRQCTGHVGCFPTVGGVTIWRILIGLPATTRSKQFRCMNEESKQRGRRVRVGMGVTKTTHHVCAIWRAVKMTN